MARDFIGDTLASYRSAGAQKDAGFYKPARSPCDSADWRGPTISALSHFPLEQYAYQSRHASDDRRRPSPRHDKPISHDSSIVGADIATATYMLLLVCPALHKTARHDIRH